MEEEEICVHSSNDGGRLVWNVTQIFGETRCRPHVRQLEQNENATDKTLRKINIFILKCLFQSFL